MTDDYLAINDILMKLVLQDIGHKRTSISFQNPTKNLSDYDLEEEMINELLKRVHQIVSFQLFGQCGRFM